MVEYIAESYLGRLPNDYFSALDEQQYVPAAAGSTPPAITGMKNLGIPTPPMQDQVQTLKQRIYQGASLVELGFMGRGKGSMNQGSTTPGMYGTPHRQALRELAKQNEIALTTHATTATGPLSGFGQQGFSEDARRQALEEMERAIDFAADVAQQGPVVVHTGEFNRRVSETRGKFTKYKSFEDASPDYFVDARTGSIIDQVRHGEEVFWPTMKRNPDGSLATDKYGQFVPEFDASSGGYKMHKLDEDDIKLIKQHYQRLAKEQGREVTITDAEAIERAKLESSMRNAEAWGAMQESRVDEELGMINDLEQVQRDMLSRWDVASEEEKRVWRNTALSYVSRGTIPPHMRDLDAREIMAKIIEQQKASLKYNQDVATYYKQQARNSEAVLENLKTVEDYAKEKTADTIARAGIYAMDKSAHNSFDGGRAKSPIFISPENVFAEQYGSHPDELRDVITSSREAMARHLVADRGMSPEEAKTKAEQHIKATFDIGHANMWKKYYNGKEADFDKWIVAEAEKLAKEGIIGHVHVSDNLGFNDEHLAPGQGSAPINEFVKRMKAQGLSNVIVEPSHNDFEVLREGWRTMAGAVSQNFPLAGDRWVNIEHSYFGRTSSPYFMFGDYTPNPEAYQPWSGVRLE